MEKHGKGLKPYIKIVTVVASILGILMLSYHRLYREVMI